MIASSAMSLKHSSVQHNACGVITTLLKDKSLLSNDIGSVFVTSKPAPEITLFYNAFSKCPSLITGPLERLKI